MKIAVYTIVKNEEKFLDKWFASAKLADYVLIADTGSNDGTVEKARQLGINVIEINVNPWRFDEARNIALNSIPADIDVCVSLDLDESLNDNWREELEKSYKPEITVYYHKYRNNSNPWQWHSKIHNRNNCQWFGVVHENLKWDMPQNEVYIDTIFLDEKQDINKDRKSYLPLLLKKIKEEKDWKTFYFLSIEYETLGDLENSIKYKIESYNAEDNTSLTKSYTSSYIARNYQSLGDLENAIKWFDISLQDSEEKENTLFYAELFYEKQDWDKCLQYAKKCINVNHKRDGFTYREEAWGNKPYDLASLSCYNLELYRDAVEYGSKALSMNPADSRLQNNLELYKEKMKKTMKVAIYTIALNEEQFVKRWYESAKDADYLLIADTGSTDNTVKLAEELGINVVTVNVVPWRFDDARNAALAALPKDIDMCISLDMDEVITPNWREPLENAWAQGITRPRYKHVWSWKEDGTPGLEFSYDHIHSRKNYRWKHPVHECLYVYGIEEKQTWIDGLETHHHPDNTKSRSQYLPLLKMSVEEDPQNDRNVFYYGRELMFHGHYQEAEQQLKKHLTLPTATWPPERATSMRYIAKCNPAEAEEWLKKSIAQAPGRREALVDLAEYYYQNSRWQECADICKQTLDITVKPLEYLCEEYAWNEKPHDLYAIALYNLSRYQEAYEQGKIACDINPADERLSNNLIFFNNALNQ
jgi:glycosyltransferase involved in cell wall biosynthesis